MGNSQSYTALNSNDKMNERTKNWLISEFNKEKNIVAKLPEIGELIRVENKKKRWKHYYFNIDGFFDPDKGFLRVLVEIYKRYNEIKLDDKEIMPFTSLIVQPLEKIQEVLKIKPGSFLDFSLSILYSFILSGVINLTTALIAAEIHPIAGVVVGAVAVGILSYEVYKGFKELKREEFIKNETNLLMNKIIDLFGDGFEQYLENCNIIEIIIDDSFNSLIDGIFNYDKNNKVKINFWNIPGINKAKQFRDFSEQKKEIYYFIAAKMKTLKNDGDFYEIYKYLGKKYRETYKKAKKLVEENKKFKKNKIKRKEILDKINEYSEPGSFDPKISDLLKELRDLE